MGKGLHFVSAGPDRKFWTSAGPIREIVKDSFIKHGLPAFKPHGFRKTLVRLGQQICQTPEEPKAWSQNSEHENVVTTITSYGALDIHRQGQVMKSIGMMIDAKESPEAASKRLIMQLAELQTMKQA